MSFSGMLFSPNSYFNITQMAKNWPYFEQTNLTLVEMLKKMEKAGSLLLFSWLSKGAI